jgi:hypothetical protein
MPPMPCAGYARRLINGNHDSSQFILFFRKLVQARHEYGPPGEGSTNVRVYRVPGTDLPGANRDRNHSAVSVERVDWAVSRSAMYFSWAGTGKRLS